MGPTLVLHTSESDAGSAQATARYLRSKGFESHTVFDPSNNEHIRLLPWSTPAKSLRNLPGGVETNNRGDVFQVEVVGRAADVPGYSSAWFANLALYVQRICGETGVPIVFPRPFVAYPASFGLHAAQRMSNDEWLAFAGVCGHQHVPESDHGDPGDMTRLVELLANPLRPLGVEDDMTPDEIKDGHLTDGSTVNDRLIWTNQQVDKAVEALNVVSAQVASLAAKVDALQVSGGQVDMDKLAGKVADLLASRLAS